MELSIIVISFNTKGITLDCLRSVLKYVREIKYELIVIDNASSDGSVDEIKQLADKHEHVKLIRSDVNLGFAGGNNLGINKSKGRYVLLLNSDTYFTTNILKNMIDWMDENPKIGISSCTLLNVDGSVQGTGGYFPTLPRVFSWMTIQDIPYVDSLIKPFHPMKEKSFNKGSSFYAKAKELDWITGAFMLIRREVFREVKKFDDKYFMYTEETDFCYRAKQTGWIVCFNPKWSIVHIGGASGTHESSILKEFNGVKRFYKKFYPSWQYPILRLLFKIGSLGRIILFGLINGKDEARIYSKVFKLV